MDPALASAQALEAGWREWEEVASRLEAWLDKALLRSTDRESLERDKVLWGKHLERLSSLTQQLMARVDPSLSPGLLARRQEIQIKWEALGRGGVLPSPTGAAGSSLVTRTVKTTTRVVGSHTLHSQNLSTALSIQTEGGAASSLGGPSSISPGGPASLSSATSSQSVGSESSVLVAGFVTRWLETVGSIVSQERPASLHELRALLQRITVAQSELHKVDTELRSARRRAGEARDPTLLAQSTDLDAQYTQLRRLLPAKARALKMVRCSACWVLRSKLLPSDSNSAVSGSERYPQSTGKQVEDDWRVVSISLTVLGLPVDRFGIPLEAGPV